MTVPNEKRRIEKANTARLTAIVDTGAIAIAFGKSTFACSKQWSLDLFMSRSFSTLLAFCSIFFVCVP